MFTAVKPGDADYTALSAFMAENVPAFDYNGLIERYNAEPVGSIIFFDYRRGKLAQLRTALKMRNLSHGKDYALSGGLENPADPNSVYVVAIRKTSDTEGAILEPKPRGRSGKGRKRKTGGGTGSTATSP